MKNRISPGQRKNTLSPPSQQSFNTQHNFMSVNQLSSVYEAENNSTTISGLRRKHLMQCLINKIKYLIAPYAMPGHIKENWNEEQNRDQNDDEKGMQRQQIMEQIKYKYGYWHLFMMVQAICAIFLFWASSIQLVFLPKFSEDNEGNLFAFETKAVPCLLIILKLIGKEAMVLHQRALQRKMQQSQKQQLSEKQIEEEDEEKEKQKSNIKNEQFINNLKDISRSIIYALACVSYLLIHALHLQELRYMIQAAIVIIFFTKVWSPKKNMQKVYSYVEAKDLKNQFRILVLFFLVLGACHFIALLLYALTYMYPENNWINSVDKVAVKQNTWLSHYTCSIYFTISTMATVGYGDFTPVQTGQMFVVSFIQLFGTALFGYMINVVGLSVVQINKKNQQFDNHISTINKLQSHYQISRQLCQKFKNDIIKNQSVKKQTPLSQNQQTQFFKMIQNSLKQQFILETNIKVIKKSIFFLTHFTVNFQNQIALKLIRKIYKKNQKLPLVDVEGQGERCMLIINSGSINIDIANQSSNIETKKFIRNIAPQEGKPTLNVFGYSALILNKDIDLQATTKDTSVIYLLKRKDVLECMDKNMLDFEGIGELRERMLQYKNINHVEAPSMMDIQKHYIPNIYFVNKRKKTICQHRDAEYKRSNRRSRIKVITLKNYQFRTMVCIDLQDSSHKQKSEQDLYKLKLQQNSRNDHQNSQSNINSLRMIQQNQGNQSLIETTMKIDQVKNYENFMKRSNINKIVNKYHEYLRKMRKNRKIMDKVQEMLKNQNKIQEKSESSKYIHSARKFTYTQGMNRITERHDQ